MAKHNGWASGAVADFENGSRGWILWVDVGLILGDTVIALGWITPQTLDPMGHRRSGKSPRVTESISQTPLLPGSLDAMLDDHDWPATSLVTTPLVISAGTALFLVYLISLLVAFQELVTTLATLIAILLTPMAGFILMRSLGETDNGASLAIGKIPSLAEANMKRKLPTN
ncbi:OPT superfamily [Neonectria magnoliae]|uniref:OPT superfamily n=1 Tax=Neonectria magnoliae TaxID=2732573 RepID=A0ABR1I6D9_9HYPO